MGTPLSWRKRLSSIVALYAYFHTMARASARPGKAAVLEEKFGIELDLYVVAVIAQAGGDIFAAAGMHGDDLGGQLDAIQPQIADRSGGGVAVFVPVVVDGVLAAGLEQVFARTETPIVHVIA